MLKMKTISIIFGILLLGSSLVLSEEVTADAPEQDLDAGESVVIVERSENTETGRDSRSYKSTSTTTYHPPPPPPNYVAPPPHRPGYNHSQPNPYSTLPGTYPKAAYGGPMYHFGKKYSPQSIYYSYLASGYYQSYSKACSKAYGQPAKISRKDLDAAFEYAKHELRKYQANERHQYQAGNYLNDSVYSSAARSQLVGYHLKNSPMEVKEKEALIMEYASQYLVKYNCLSKLDATLLLPNVKVDVVGKSPYGDKTCHSAYGAPDKSLNCRFYDKYRTIDGSCNNWKHPYWGKSFVCHLRLVPSAYDDGLSMPRVYSYTGKYLPGARVISTLAHNDVPDRAYYTLMKMAWGQYINHDITNTPTTNAEYGGMIDCCKKPNSHPQCMPIMIPAYGDYQSKDKRTCMNFVRSTPCPLCTLGPRQQINIGTSFLDNSATYGSSPDDMKRLRSYQYGYLKMGKDIYGRDILPPTSTPYQSQCESKYPGKKCFDAGDPRVSQHPNLQLLHLLWARRHNQHAKQLHRVNPKWNDEILFQEARRIAIAELQLMSYAEYLPIVFGPTLMKYYNLDVDSYGYSKYEPYTDPTTWNDYAVAACRFGHSQIAGFQSLIGGTGKYNQTKGYWLRDWWFDPDFLHDGQCDAITRGLLHDRSQTVDPWMANDIVNYLYKSKKEKYGNDLPAFNIQRGRDHGTAPYHVYLEFCFGFKAYSWDDLGKFIPYYQLKILRSLYHDWRDVDFWTGGMSERKFPDADTGPTFACVLGIQYYHIKFGDRFFATHGGQAGSFTPAQLANLRKVATLSNFLCKTGDYITAVQKYAFFPVANYNPLIPCKSMPEIDYNLWKAKEY